MEWIKFSYSDENNLDCKIKKNCIDIKKQSGLILSLETIDKISKEHSKPFILMCSGGVDSQAMAYAWKNSNIPHEIVLFEYVDDRGNIYNDHDLTTFLIFAEREKINFQIKKFNYFSFLENDLINYAVKYNCASPQITCMINLIENIGKGTVILSGNYWQSAYNDLPFNYDILGLHRFSLIPKEFSVIPFFFLYSSNLAFGFTNPKNSKYSDKKTYYQKKCETYLINGFPIIPQEEKLSGFEKIKDYFDNCKDLFTPLDRLKFLNMPSKRNFDIKYRYMLRQSLGKEPKINLIIE